MLRDLTPSALEEGKQFINEKRIGIHLKEGIQEKLYIEVKCSTDDDSATAYKVTGTKVSYTLAWRPENYETEYAVCLANIILSKTEVN